MTKFISIVDRIPNLGYIIFSGASLLIFLIAYFYNYNINRIDIAEKASIIFAYSSLGLIIKNGLFHKNKFFRFFLLSISILLISVIFKIQHLNYSSEILIIALSLSILSYSLYFFKKKNKLILDYIKWIYFTSFVILKLISINHYLYFDEIWLINFISTVLVVILIYIKHKKSPNWLGQ